MAHTLTDTSRPCHLDGIVVTADAIHVRDQLVHQEEARNQIAFADRILLTKTDLVTPAEADSTEPVIRAFNANAPIRRVIDGDVTPDDVFGLGVEQHPATWLRAAEHDHDHTHEHHHDHAGVASTVLRADEPISGLALVSWLNSLLSLHGANVLRVKGIVRIAGDARPIVLQAVHHVLHRLVRLSPEAVAAWAEGATGGGGEIVVIHRGLPDAGLRASFTVALDAGG